MIDIIFPKNLNYNIENFLESFFLILLLFISIIFTFTKDLIHAIFLLVFFSFILSILYLLMNSPDVSMTESAVNACITSVFSLSSLVIIDKAKKINSTKFSKMAFFLITILASIFIYSTAFMPLYGDFSAPVHNHISAYYLANSGYEIGIPSTIASILASYRGFDTLGETSVIVIAGLCIFMLLYEENILPNLNLTKDIYLISMAKIIIPIIAIYAFYIQIHGEISPGGGFQAGSILASLFIFYGIITSGNHLEKYFSFNWLKNTSIIGLLIYIGTGIASLYLGGEFLDYSLLSELDQEGEKLGIFVIETGVGISVFAVITFIFLLFASEGEKYDREF